ncbi:hypothetical protein I302_105926 [Kwoniella bestiolae CBS 10118]|uniref:Oxidoreductase n=1 Tax=Kwoniella bestiolae CBS 10118 TaxID=1296100 RepID=A0A1B9G2I8_9TREE|nr:oxidoreductase [Kwoniella bestiolae CBS 10118]OCF25237.1 oxidoreductase [Kwoniella bestiolae CBS 10118]
MTKTKTDHEHAQPIYPYPLSTVPSYPSYLPAQTQAIGSLLPVREYPQNENPPKLFEGLTIRGVEFGNRCWVSPMCQYSSDNGHATTHHLVHIGSMAMRGWGAIMMEATSVVPEGRITPGDAGIWTDSQIAPLKQIVDYVHALKGVIGIQLSHAGRKASVLPPWDLRQATQKGYSGGTVVSEQYGGWPDDVQAPSAISFNPGKYPDPNEASLEYIENLKLKFDEAVERCGKVGFDFIEIHGAHGYFLHEIVDPISNTRRDQYGGSFENRVRLPLEIARSIRAKWDKPLFYRVSATDWLEEDLGPERDERGEWKWWGIEQTTLLARELAKIGIDLLDVTTGGNDLRQKIKVGPSYQTPLAVHLKKNVPNILVGTVGIITEAKQANDILEQGKADVVFCARQVLRDIDFPLEAAMDLGVAVNPAVQYELAWSRMLKNRREVHHTCAERYGITEVQGGEGKQLRM